MEFWIKKMASKGSIAFLALPALAAFSIPVASIPVGVAGAAVALLGYNWQSAYEKSEQDTRLVIKELIGLDEILRHTEEGLSNHERVLSLLMEEVGNVLRHVNQSQARFGYIQVRRSYSTREIGFLTNGVASTKSAVNTLKQRYESSMAVLFKRILARATTVPPALLELPMEGTAGEISLDQAREPIEARNSNRIP
jgi:hypothetical protein